MDKNNIFLAIGLSIMGFAVGYMIGGSSTPVVKVIIPLLFGLIVTLFGLFQPYKQVKDLPNNLDSELIKIIIDKIEKNSSNTKKIIGIVLIFFSFFYLFGTVVGSYIRINKTFVNTGSPGFPWGKNNEPKEIKVALDWITLQINLEKLGYEKNEISSLYQIQMAELENHREIEKEGNTDLLKQIAILNDLKKGDTNSILLPLVDPTAPFMVKPAVIPNLTDEFIKNLSETPETQWSNESSR